MRRYKYEMRTKRVGGHIVPVKHVVNNGSTEKEQDVKEVKKGVHVAEQEINIKKPKKQKEKKEATKEDKLKEMSRIFNIKKPNHNIKGGSIKLI